MGALAPLRQWIPEDDLLLKNAVEAGASLESLAKGAVHFSRRFTIKELQDRWRSLLYDPEISAEASLRMVNIEVEASISNQLKPGKSCYIRFKEWTPRKRKGDSIRSRYYAIRKRVCNAPYGSADVDFSVPHHATVDIDAEKSGNLHLDRNYMLGSAVSDQFRIPGSGFGIGHDTFSQMLKGNAIIATTNAVDEDISETHMTIAGNQISDEIVNSNGSFGFGEKFPPLSDCNGIGNNIVQSFECKTVQKDDSHIIGGDIETFEDNSAIQKIGSPPSVSVRDPPENSKIETASFPSLSSENDNKRLPPSGFGDQNINTEVSDCSGSLHNIGFSSPLVPMSIWGGIDAAQPLSMGPNFDDNEQRTTLTRTGDMEKIMSGAYDAAGIDQKLHNELSINTLTDRTGLAEGDFVNLSLAFENDDELFLLNEDEKDMIDGSCLDTLDAILSDSPTDIHHDDMYGSSEPKRLDVINAEDVVLDGDCLEEPKGLCERISSSFEHISDDSLENVQEVPSKPLYPPEPLEGFVICNLNTEDPEIPCNDDVILPNEVVPPISSDLNMDSEVTGNLADEIISEDGRCMEEGHKTSVDHCISSPNVLAPAHVKVGYLTDVNRIKTESQEIECLSKGYRKPGVSTDGTSTLSSSKIAPFIVKEEAAALDLGKCEFFYASTDLLLENSHGSSYHAKSNFHIRTDVCEKVLDSAGSVQKKMPSGDELGCRDTDLTHIASTSDQEDKVSGSDDDIPNFSDIEAMILDMDLGLSDQEHSLFAREVSRYQYMETKKAIIKLEQGAQSCIQRAIASHGAFAIFYGRRLKHYIKKAEISLGRATDDVCVDIDLRREGPANKISRRQAIIKMDEHGTFHLKNTGKCAVLVSGKEVLTGMQLNITSGCLIEIRGMKFIFEVNQNSVCQFLANVQRKA